MGKARHERIEPANHKSASARGLGPAADNAAVSSSIWSWLPEDLVESCGGAAISSAIVDRERDVSRHSRDSLEFAAGSAVIMKLRRVS